MIYGVKMKDPFGNTKYLNGLFFTSKLREIRCEVKIMQFGMFWVVFEIRILSLFIINGIY